jgi:ABC-type branched-subunit amino acid transport system substrate-binding protein
MAHKMSRFLAAAAFIATVASWAVSWSSASAGASGNGLKTLSVGLLTDLTGPGASSSATSVLGVKAGVYLAKRDGYDLRYYVGDTATSTTTGLSAGQSLVEQHHVLAVIAVSALTFSAAPFFKAQGTPVIGAAQDADEWLTDPNMFTVFGAGHTNLVSTTFGAYMKSQGVTNLGSIGYDIAPSSAEAAEAAAASAEHAGIKVGYLNAAFPFGSTNVQPVALAMKAAGINGFTAATDVNTAYALLAALKNLGVHLKASLLYTGYGGDVTNQATPEEQQAALGVSFENPYEVMEQNTPATKQFAADLKSAGIKGLPTQAEYDAYESVGLLLQGLKGAGGNPTQASLIASLSKIHNWSALGMWGGRTLDINNRTSIIGGVDNCMWIAKLEAKGFVVVPGAAPICGKPVPGVSVSPPT